MAWALDACINDKKLDYKRMDTLRSVLLPYDRPHSSAGARPASWLTPVGPRLRTCPVLGARVWSGSQWNLCRA